MRRNFVGIVASCAFFAISILTPAPAQAIYANVGVVQNNLLMYFDLANQNALSGTLLTDLSGNFVSSTLTQISSQPSLNTANGRYLNFTGNGGYVDLPDIVSATNWTGLSVSFYANFGTLSNFERIFDFGNGSTQNNIWVGKTDLSDVAIEVFHDTSSPGWCRSTSGSLVANEWAHWTFVLDGTTCKVYKNNVFNQSTNYTYLPWARTLANNYIGKSNWNDPYFEGGIADLAIYKSALSDSERTQNYNAQTDITGPAVSGNFLGSPENQLNVSTLNLEAGATYTKLAGLDAGKLNISSSGVIAFLTNPNYEARDSANGTFQYQINVRAVDSSGNYVDFVLQVTVTDMQESAAISMPSLSATPYKGVPLTITVTPSGDGTSIPGKITYLLAGKRIPACYKKMYSGTGNSTCIFEPSIQGNREISVTFTPTNTNFTAVTSKKTFFIYKRTTIR